MTVRYIQEVWRILLVNYDLKEVTCPMKLVVAPQSSSP